jgi:hypothetical protein
MFYGNTINIENDIIEDISEQQFTEALINCEDAMILAEDYIEYFEENANSDLGKKVKEIEKRYNGYIGAARSCIKRKEFEKASDELKNARGVLSDFRKAIDEMESESSDALLGLGLGSLMVMAKLTKNVLTPIVPTVLLKNIKWDSKSFGDFNVTGFKSILIIKSAIFAITEIPSSILIIINELKNGETVANSLNFYRTQMIKYVKDLDYNIGKVRKEIKKAK